MAEKDNKKAIITRRRFLQATTISVFLAFMYRKQLISAFMGLFDTDTSLDNKFTAWTSWLWRQTNRSQFDAGLFSNIDSADSPGNIKLAVFSSPGTITSQVFDSEKSGTRWDAVIWDSTLPVDTDITFEVRASDTPFNKDSGSPSWSSPSGTSPIQTGIPAGRYMQWRATLTTNDNSATPVLEEVRVYYSLDGGSVQVTDIGATSGTAKVGQVLTAGSLTPAAASVAYQWQKSSSISSPFSDISGANSTTYSIIAGDVSNYLRVMATGTSGYKGSVASAYVGPVSADSIPLTAVSIIGTVGVGQTLTADLTPANGTATYKWLISSTQNGTYTEISGATSDSYVVDVADYEQYIKVEATGYGSYSGTVTSSPTSQVAGGQLISISPIIGSTVIGQTLTAGTVYPLGATVTYQWQQYDNGTWINCMTESNAEATSDTYKVWSANTNRYLRVVVTGTGAYTGTLDAVTSDLVQESSTPVTAIDTIGGVAEVGHLLTVGVLTPQGATATYKWLRSDTSGGTYLPISGASLSTYTLTNDDYTKYIKVEATGSGVYSGTVTSAYMGPIAKGQITAIGSIIGTTVVGQTLTAGALTPATATADYQWQRLVSGVWTDISGATANNYTLIGDDLGTYVRVVATGNGYYTGSVNVGTISVITGTQTPITAIGAIYGTMQVAQTLVAGTLTPANATVTWQWMRSQTAEGTYSNIAGATSDSYILTAGDLNYYIKVKATGSGSYSGTVTSDYRGPVGQTALISIGPVIGTTSQGYTLTAGALTPQGATVSYQWHLSNWDGNTWNPISGAISNTHTVRGADNGGFLKVVATGTGAYTGSVEAITSARVSGSATPVTAIGDISGVAEVGVTLSAGALTPAAATVTYQWQRHDTASGEYDNIVGAASSTYKLTAADCNHYIKLMATGAGAYTGIVFSDYIGPVAAAALTAIGNISGSTVVGEMLTAGTPVPSGAAVTYQWQKSATENGTYADIIGATYNTYNITENDEGYYFKVKATGTNGYSGTVYSNAIGPVVSEATPITAIGTISGTAQVEQTLTAGALTPAAATATYRWKKADTVDGTYSNISGATSSTYQLTADEFNKYIKVEAIGSGEYSESVLSAAVGPVTACPITAMAAVIGTPLVGNTLTAGALTPAAATVTYQWQRSDTGSGTTFTDISGATTNTYYIQNSQYNYSYLRVVATGTGAYTGSVSARTVLRVGGAA
ncbi:MAG: hypothetical protein WC958_02025 [Dehalococcoidales bacterium]